MNKSFVCHEQELLLISNNIQTFYVTMKQIALICLTFIISVCVVQIRYLSELASQVIEATVWYAIFVQLWTKHKSNIIPTNKSGAIVSVDMFL